MRTYAYRRAYDRTMKTAGLLKHAEDTAQGASPSAEDLAISGGEAGLAAALLPGSYRRSTGLQRLYHGTPSDEAYEAIRREGLRTDKGGSGASKINPEYIERSKGTVHVSPRKTIGNMFAMNDFNDEGLFAQDPEDMDMQMFRRHKRNLSIDMPLMKYERDFVGDPDFASGLDEVEDGPLKLTKDYIAGKSSKDLDPRYIRQSDDFSRRKVLIEALKELPEYAKRKPKRLLAGVAGLGASGGLGYDAYRRLAQSLEE